ncbi:pyridine nucleotide-disulfide oxidoreductase, partial [Oesophagostomum dentatum]
GFFVPVEELPTTIHGGVSLLKGRRVERISPEEKKVYLDDKTCIKYDKCLIATGGKPKTLPVLEESEVKEKVVYLHGVEDYQKLESICNSSKSVTIIGGGFLGSELAYSIHRKYGDLAVNQVIAESGNLSDVLPEHLSKKAAESLREAGVNVLANARVTSARRKESGVELEINNSKKIKSDYVVVAIGVDPDVTLAKSSGLEVDDRLGGITTDAELRVRSGIWAAGDAASFYDKSLGRRRIEHWENAQISGRLAGENMTGACKAFWYQPSFFTKIAPKWHINAVGNTNSSLPTVSVFAKDDDDKESYDRGVVFYKGDNGKVISMLS